jgi:NAD(P)-dependent dehydrogenase (short-subunit alcohol dehydrogenase family)
VTGQTETRSMEGRRIIVSGATSGIGRGSAEMLAARGARVWILGSRAQRLERTLAELPGLAGGTLCDVSDDAAVERAFAEATEVLGGVDGAFVNAGIDGAGTPTLELTTAGLRRVLDVNVVGAFSVAREAAVRMDSGGAIVFNASINAYQPEAHFADYNASKAAVLSLAQTLAIELAASGIQVNTICPGYIPTDMTQQYVEDPEISAELLDNIPAGRFGTVEEVAELVCFLLSGKAGYMAGAVVSIDGGRSV